MADERFLSRELSWIAFNERVLQLAIRAGHPAARAGEVLRHHVDEPRRVLPGARRRAQGPDRRRHRPCVDRRTHADAAAGGHRRVDPAVSSNDSMRRSSISLVPELRAARASTSSRMAKRHPSEHRALDTFYDERVFPVLTPLAVDPGHPFPYISDLALSLAVTVADPETGDRRFARLKVPNVFPRLVRVVARPLPAGRAAHRGRASTGCSSAW